MILAIGSDHAGYELKQEMVSLCASMGHQVVDMGAHSTEAADYPDYARAVSREVIEHRAERGLIICGSGVGACVAANKVKGIRAGTCHDTFSARQGVEDDDMNVLCMGARIIGIELAREITRAFLAANFSGLERHQRRLNKVLEIERVGR